MLCINPYRTGRGEFGCGRCHCCRINKRREWTGRILLESFCHTHNSMVTLTYADAPPELKPEDMQLFLKRLRSIYPAPLRYYGVGEYGDIRGRPHFHLALFGLSILDSEYIGKAWSIDGEPIGGFHIGELNRLTAQYLCGYVTKKMTKKDDVALKGRHPEFARMSLRPGIGATAIATLKAAVAPNGDLTTIVKRGDVPESMRSAGKTFPLGRYLRGKLRTAIGWEETQPGQMRALIEAAYLARSQEEIKATEQKRQNQYDTAAARLKLDRSKKRL